MAQFRIKIAGHTAQVCSLFDSTRDYCRAYLTEEAPEFSITVTKADLEFEQRFLEEEARQEGMRRRVFSDPFLDRAAIQRKMAENLLEYDVLLLHGSTVAVDGRAYLFTAQCGTGKSTHTRLWRENFGQRAVMVNDDKPFLTVTEEGVLASGAPWSGKHGLDSNITVPLQGICILTRGTENRIGRILPAEAEAMVRHQSLLPLDESRLPRYESLINRLLRCVPFWQMQCNKEIRAAQISYEAMKPND